MQNPFFILLALPFFGFPKIAGSDNVPEIYTRHSLRPGHDLTISYDISISTKKKSSGIGETYNGGVKTIFIKDGMARERLVSLMRMQDIFLLKQPAANKLIALVKESGKNKYKTYLTAAEWKQYNNKYEGLTCAFQRDTAVILKRTCKKALINLKNGKSISVYYFGQEKKPEYGLLEPAFACIPGLILQYEYKSRKGTIVYTATSISNDPVDPAALAVPENGYANRKYMPDLKKAR